MESYALVREGDPSEAEWVLAWDDSVLTLDTPDGQRVFEGPLSNAHRLVEVYELYSNGRVSFGTPDGSLSFKKNTPSVAAVRRLVELGIAADPEYGAEIRRRSLRVIMFGLVLFVICGSLFGVYFWFAIWEPDLPPGHWIRWFGSVIRWMLLFLMAGVMAGPVLVYQGLRLWVRVRTIERLVAENSK